MNLGVVDQDFNPMEPDNDPEDNQPPDIVNQAQPNQFNEDVEDNQLVRNQDGTIQLIFSSFFTLLCLLKTVNSKISNFSKRLQKIEEKNDMRALAREIIDKEFYRSLRAVLKRDLVLSVVHSLFKKPLASLSEFYCRVLSVYMLNTPLPKRLNGLLKGGIFSQTDDLLPFLLCLCKAFFCQTLNLNQVGGQVEAPPFNFYQEVEGDENSYFLWKKIQLKEFWIMKTEKPDFLKLLGRDVLIRYRGSYYELMAPTSVLSFSNQARYIRTCLYIEVPEEITRDLNYSVYIKLVQEKILFVKEANQVILAPGCYFIVDELIEIPVKKVEEKKAESLDERIRIIKLKMITKTSQRFQLEEEQEQGLRQVEEEVIPLEEVEPEEEENEEDQEEQQAGFEVEMTIWNTQIYEKWNLNFV